ncbi:MAG TPA: MFS transporter [Tepidisphaeraceae bacterium]|nr:MFS transporter [Tepidisphaeraceae bacterium]
MEAVSVDRPDYGVATDPTRTTLRFARIIPIAFITYGLAYFDRVNFGYAEASGLKTTLGVTTKVSGLIAASFFIGYTFFQIPGAAYAAHRSAKKLIFWALILWGLLCAAQGLAGNAWSLGIVRTLLGVVESVVFPGMLVFLTHWFTRRERSRANTLLILGNPITMASVSVISGFVIAYFDRHPVHGLAGWQMMFVVEGLPSVAWAICWWWLADDRPLDARWLSEAEAAAVQRKLDGEQHGIKPMGNYRAAFADRRVVLMSLMYFCWSIGTYGFVFWLPKTVKDASGFSISTTGVLCAVPYLLAVLTMMIVSYWSDRLLKRKIFIWPAMVIGGLAFLIAGLVGAGHFWVAFAALAFAGASVYTPCGPLWALMAEMVPRNVVGESMALVNSAGAVGGFVGTYALGFFNGYFHSAGPGFVFLAGSLIAAGLITIFVNAGHAEPAGFPIAVSTSSLSGR